MRKYKNTEFPHLHNPVCEARIASRDELSAYIDKELPAWKRYLIQQHLKKCGTCTGYVQRLRKTDTFLRQSGEVEVSTDFLADVMRRVSEMTQHQRQQTSLWAPRRATSEIGIRNASDEVVRTCPNIGGQTSPEYSDTEPYLHIRLNLLCFYDGRGNALPLW